MAAIHSGLAVTTQLRWEGGPCPSPSTTLHRAPELARGSAGLGTQLTPVSLEWCLFHALLQEGKEKCPDFRPAMQMAKA